MDIGTRLGAGLGALGTVVGGSVSPLTNVENNNYHPELNNDIPAIYQSMDEPIRSPEQAAEQFINNDSNWSNSNNADESKQPAVLQNDNPSEATQSNTAQKLGEIGENLEDIGDGLAEASRRKDEANENEKQNSALNKPELAVTNDKDPTQYQEQYIDNGQDYYNGIGY